MIIGNKDITAVADMKAEIEALRAQLDNHVCQAPLPDKRIRADLASIYRRLEALHGSVVDTPRRMIGDITTDVWSLLHRLGGMP